MTGQKRIEELKRTTELKMMVCLEEYDDGNMGLDENRQTIKTPTISLFRGQNLRSRNQVTLKKRTGIRMGFVNMSIS